MLNVGAASALCGQISVASKLPRDGHSLSVAKEVGAKLLGGDYAFPHNSARKSKVNFNFTFRKAIRQAQQLQQLRAELPPSFTPYPFGLQPRLRQKAWARDDWWAAAVARERAKVFVQIRLPKLGTHSPQPSSPSGGNSNEKWVN